MARKSRANNALIISDTKNRIWNAGLYGRLSVEDGDDTEQNSIGNQKKIGNHFLSTRADIVLVDTYSDNRYSERTHCTSHYVRQEQIYAVVKDAMNQQIKVAVDIEQLVVSIKNSPKTKQALTEATENSGRISAKRQKVENRMERLLTDLTERMIDRNE